MSAYLKRLDISNVGNAAEEQPTAYMKRVHIVEVVDSDGNPWEPVPGPDPWDELVKDKPSQINTATPLPVGTTINGTTGTFTGGDPENTTYRYRWRTRPVGGSWTNESWTTGWSNEPLPVTYDLAADKFNYQIQLQTQARDDAQDPPIQVLNNSGTKNTEKSTIGDVSVTINDIDYDLVNQAPLTILMNDPIVVVVSINGNAQNVTYNWAARNDYPLMVGSQGSASTVLTFPQEGGPTVTCTISDPASQEQVISIGMNFYVVDAFD